MTDIEIPLVKDRGWGYRLLEIFPGSLALLLFIIPIVLSLFNTLLAAIYIVSFIVVWFFRFLNMALRMIQGYSRVNKAVALNWQEYLDDVDQAETKVDHYKDAKNKADVAHYLNLQTAINSNQTKLNSNQVIHAVFVALSVEPYEVIQPTIEAIKRSNFDVKNQLVLVIAYEQRIDSAHDIAKRLQQEYSDVFMDLLIIGHPDGLPNEVRGKGGNINFAAGEFDAWVDNRQIDPERILVTTLDSDNRPHPNYFLAMSYNYLVADDRRHKSFQPVIIYTNNIWDVPASNRVLALGNTFWTMLNSFRPHLLRNFSSHAQGWAALKDTNYWSGRTIVEDGHQFWRSYIRFDGRHDVIPSFVPIYQDAVLAEGYWRTIKAQYKQFRRWAWGASDIAYLVTKGYLTPNKIPKLDLLGKAIRLIDDHVARSTTPLLIAFSAWLPMLLHFGNPDNLISEQLPLIITRLQTLASIGIFLAMYIGFRIIPKRPKKYGLGKSFMMLIQWFLVPPLTIIFGAVPAIDAQVRLMFGKYLGFEITEKAVKD